MKEDRIVIRKIIGVAGAIVMFFGMFASAKRYIGPESNFFELGSGSWLLAVIAIVTLIFSVTNLHKWIWIPCLSAFAFMGYMLHRLQVEYLEMKVGLEQEIAGKFFVNLERSINNLQLSRYEIVPDAWVAISVGALIVLASQLVKVESDAQKQ